MLRRTLTQASSWRSRPVCLFCAAQTQLQLPPVRSFGTTVPLLKRSKSRVRKHFAKQEKNEQDEQNEQEEETPTKAKSKRSKSKRSGDDAVTKKSTIAKAKRSKDTAAKENATVSTRKTGKAGKAGKADKAKDADKKKETDKAAEQSMSLKDALLRKNKRNRDKEELLQIEIVDANELTFEPVPLDIPPVPMLSYGLDRVLFNPGVYRLQDPRSRLYNFDPYLEKIMPVNEFDFDALSEYKTSSKDQTLLDLTKSMGTKFTGSTSSMSGVLQHFHYLLSNFRELNHNMLSRGFPEPSKKFSKITLGPSAIFMRYKDGIYAIDADKSYDKPNIMSWLGHSLEKLLTTERGEFELFRRSNPGEAPAEDNSSRCYHYSRLGNVLMRSQLDAQDPRLPGTGVFDLKTRAVVSIRMNHKEYEKGSGYQLRFAQGEWESYEREFYDMTRATLLKYSLQVRMGRMDGIFVAYHNIERIFGFQYLSLPDMDRVLHGQEDTTLGDQEFKLSISLLDELLTKATVQFPETSIRMHFDARETSTPFMYIFAEPVSEELADEIQGSGETAQKDFARTVVGLGKDDPEVQAAWQSIQDKVDEQVDQDEQGKNSVEASEDQVQETIEEETSEQDGVPSSLQELTESEVDQNTEDATSEDVTPPPPPPPSGPLMGWTLTVRSKVNDTYVTRATKITEEDSWKLEYHIQEIPEVSRWKLYTAVKERRRNLVGIEDESANKGLESYRSLIQRVSNRGREWRDQQDKLDEAKGVHVYRTMGPGSEETN